MIDNLLLLVLQLRIIADMLPRTSATQSEVQTKRSDTVSSVFDDLGYSRLQEVAFDLRQTRVYEVARRTALQKHHDAVDSRDTLALSSHCANPDVFNYITFFH